MIELASITLDKRIFSDFCREVSSFFPSKDLSSFVNNNELVQKISDIAANDFADEIKKLATNVVDPCIAIGSLDIPRLDGHDSAEDMFYSIVASIAINKNIFNPVVDKHLETPFSLMQASDEEHRKLSEAGLDYFRPEDKLGFHSDGAYASDRIYIPDHVSTYNIFLGYANPGYFYWVPKAMWARYSEFREKIGESEVRFKLSPITYTKTGGSLKVVRNDTIKIPIFCGDSIFLNGKIVDEDERIFSLATEMRASIGDNEFRIGIRQAAKRLIVAKNSFGFHARDVFEVPLVKEGFTRSMIRQIDSSGSTAKVIS
jgi:hypothetical protein